MGVTDQESMAGLKTGCDILKTGLDCMEAVKALCSNLPESATTVLDTVKAQAEAQGTKVCNMLDGSVSPSSTCIDCAKAFKEADGCEPSKADAAAQSMADGCQNDACG